VEGAENLFDRPVESVGAFDRDGGMGLRRQDVEIGHGFCRGIELGADGFFGAAALAHVAVDAAIEADLVGSVDVDAEVVERYQLGVVEREDAFDEDDASRRDGVEGVGDPGVAGEVVHRALNGQALGEGADVFDDEFGFERIRMVEVLLVARVERELGKVAVVEVEREERGIELGGELGGERGFSGAGAASDSDDYGTSWTSQWRLFAGLHGYGISLTTSEAYERRLYCGNQAKYRDPRNAVFCRV
jgi:hypothetical protein